jgi:hypoxanthine phosphoribosyltransferase
MENEKFYDNKFVKTALLEIVRQMYDMEYKPDYIVGLVRGGLVPGVMLSHYLDIPFYSLDPNESNLWMAEDAFGYVPADDQQVIKSRWDVSYRKNILIIDDINDSGKTFTNLKEDWQSGCLPKESAWNTVWHKNVKFATLIENQASDFDADFVGLEINKLENPEWCVFPWERWW